MISVDNQNLFHMVGITKTRHRFEMRGRSFKEVVRECLSVCLILEKALPEEAEQSDTL